MSEIVQLPAPAAGTAVAPAAYQRIATEEAWAPPELFDVYADLLDDGKLNDPAFESLWKFYLRSNAERPRLIRARLEDLGERRLGDMAASGIDKQIIALTAPGVQPMDKPTARSFVRMANDRLAAGVCAHPEHFVGMAAIAPQDPAAAALEIERAVQTLGMRGVIVNGHTHGEYLDDQKFWPILEAAEALGVPLYLHPAGPPASMVAPFLEAGLDGAIFGFAVDNGLHALRMIVRGVFDRFPNLKLILGHMGEGLPFWLYRLDYMHRAAVNSRRYPHLHNCERMPSDYMRENVWVTTSGVAWEPAITFCQQVLGVDRVLYAMDYPYQFEAGEVVATDVVDNDDEQKAMLFQTNAERVFGL